MAGSEIFQTPAIYLFVRYFSGIKGRLQIVFSFFAELG